MPALVTRTLAPKITVVGGLNFPSIIRLIREGSFDHPVIKPWEALLENMSSPGNLREGLQQSWSHLTSMFQDVVTPEILSDGGLLLTQATSSVGLYADGTRANSFTGAIMRELEGARSKALGVAMETDLDHGDYELWAWMAWTLMSSEFLHAPPESFGFLEDNIFQVGLVTYLEMPCPVMAPMVGRFLAKIERSWTNLGPILLGRLCQVKDTGSCTIFSSQSPNQ